MTEIQTKYGLLTDVTAEEYYPEGSLKGVVLGSPQPLDTPYGKLIPQYENDGTRRKFTHSLMFYPDGGLRSISLQNQTVIPTPIGNLPAEMLTFYENGNLKRLFPLNGKLSGFWSEADEAALAEPLAFDFPFASFSCKVIGILFYETGAVKSLTLWPGETVTLKTQAGTLPVRNGFSLYSNGVLASLEPLRPTIIPTPIGPITAFDTNALGIHADTNSLCFTSDGIVKSIVTSGDRITVRDASDRTHIFQPDVKPSLLFEEKMDLVPLMVEFSDEKVNFTTSGSTVCLDRTGLEIRIDNLPLPVRPACSDCAGCDGCR